MIYLYLGLLIGGCVGFFAAGLMRVAKITELESDLRSADVAAWQEELVNALTITDGDTSYIRTDLVINANGQ